MDTALVAPVLAPSAQMSEQVLGLLSAQELARVWAARVSARMSVRVSVPTSARVRLPWQSMPGSTSRNKKFS